MMNQIATPSVAMVELSEEEAERVYGGLLPAVVVGAGAVLGAAAGGYNAAMSGGNVWGGMAAGAVAGAGGAIMTLGIAGTAVVGGTMAAGGIMMGGLFGS